MSNLDDFLDRKEIGEMMDAQEAYQESIRLNGWGDEFALNRIKGILAVAEARQKAHEEHSQSSTSNLGTL
jgi:hypothetical protein